LRAAVLARRPDEAAEQHEHGQERDQAGDDGRDERR
jgi:hypothetical protein